MSVRLLQLPSAVLFVLLACGHARADGADAVPGVTTTVDPCVPVDADQFQRVLGIELGTSIDYRDEGDEAPHEAGPEPGLTWVHVSCVPQGIEVRLEDGITRKSMARVLDASRLEPSSRTRLLALAVAEFVVASWVELRISTTPAVEPVGPAPPTAARASASSVAARRVRQEGSRDAGAPALDGTRWDVAAVFRLEAWSSLSTLAPSVGLRVGQHPYGHLTFSLGLDFGVARETVSGGQVDLTFGSALGALLFVARTDALDVYAGAGGRFGFVRMAGLPSDRQARAGLDFTAPFGGLLALGRAAYRVTSTFRLVAELEAAAVTLRARGLEQRSVVIALEGASLSLGVGVGWAF